MDKWLAMLTKWFQGIWKRLSCKHPDVTTEHLGVVESDAGDYEIIRTKVTCTSCGYWHYDHVVEILEHVYDVS